MVSILVVLALLLKVEILFSLDVLRLPVHLTEQDDSRESGPELQTDQEANHKDRCVEHEHAT